MNTSFNTLTIMRIILLFIIITLIHPVTSTAHELWISPDDFTVEPQGRLVANFVNGENFQGHALPYMPQASRRFDLVIGNRVQQIKARAGDRPALEMAAESEGLHVVVYQTATATLTYDKWQKFGNFIAHKDLPTNLEAHLARGLPEAGFIEAYSRYSKALIAVGAGAGADRRMGLETELVALANPYTDALPEGLPVQLFYGEGVRTGEQIEIFAKSPDGTIEVSLVRSDAQGIALIAVKPGYIYMLDAVVLRQPDPELAAETGAVWHSLWANLTFAMPADDD